jgi:hypothetical protein
MKDSNREAFESWATDKFPIAGLGQFEKHNNGTYLQRSIRNMYEAWQAAKAQAVPEVISIGNELQSWVAVNSFSADDGEGVLPVVDANAIAEKIEELTGANQ